MTARVRALLLFAAVIVVGIVAWAVVALRPAAGIEASGTIEATQSDVAPKVEGRMLDLLVRDGDRVKKGQILARLEQSDRTRAARDSGRRLAASHVG